MLTKQIISYCNRLLATTVLYITFVDPIQELANNLDHHLRQNLIITSNDNDELHNKRLPSLALASTADQNGNQDYYEILGVSKEATKHEIHKAFRQLAKKYHPDKNKDKNAQDEFIKVFKAYETLSNETKRKEYDERVKASSSYGTFNGGNGWHQTTTSMNDNFDVNEFFKQYEDQFLKHAQYFQQQHFEQHHKTHQNSHNNHIHEQFSFNGVNLDDLFHDIDEDEFQSFGKMFDFTSHNNHNHLHSHHYDHADDHLDGIFGDGASFFGTHFPPQIHNTLNQYQQQQQQQHVHSSSGQNKAGYSCQTVTKQVNGMVMTQTSCM